ncbi:MULTISPECIES: SDR family NAD(P)-dependent oxidoreductase [Vibrio]|uniref:SDR family NAD(P)-dependent oxidoreductase n=1 Tax=Vibrio TaxID=662 RepID=UPI0028FC2341|nr:MULTISPECIES: SDR family NAD(P)-dependent oxidoreductase [Vibrio]MDW1550941.1 SDR family NAD(P)-dependent oxidoreductase [Vibrio sp. YT-18]WNW09332.1 SDR family NAD(P)-dependent oxidoreductase [Vibrio alginolyticus]
MRKTILVTGSTDGIGLETAKMLIKCEQHVIIHGRNIEKVQQVEQSLREMKSGKVESLVADLSSPNAVKQIVMEITERFNHLDVIINNAGVYATPNPRTKEGLDIRFAVNTIAPYLLTRELLPLLGDTGRVVNLSSAAQTTVNTSALLGNKPLSDGEAYAQSKLALTMWSRAIGLKLKNTGPMLVSVNPKSFLGSKMVKDAYGVAGGDIRLGADILTRAALSEEFAQAHGMYFDNDIEAFAPPHPDALDQSKTQQIIDSIELILSKPY